MNRTLSVPACLAMVALIAALQHFVMDREDMVEPITTSGVATEAVNTDDFTVEITEVELTDSLSISDGLSMSESDGLDAVDEVVEANGAWVVVWARLTATHSTIDTFPAELQMKDGTTYFERGWFFDSIDRETLSPGIPLHGAFVFEVPVERIEEPVLVVTNAHAYDGRLSAQASVDLALTDTEPADEPAVLRPPEVQTEEDTHAAE